MTAEVTKVGLFEMQVCVPNSWGDKQVIEFAEQKNPCGTSNGWYIRKSGNSALSGAPERVTCLKNTENVHIMLEA